jgi:hypothetical protein
MGLPNRVNDVLPITGRCALVSACWQTGTGITRSAPLHFTDRQQ